MAELIIIASPFCLLFFGTAPLDLLAWLMGLPPLSRFPYVNGALLLIAIPLSVALAIYQYRKLKRHVIAHRGHLCPRCRYDLNATMTADRCPECGTENDPAAIRRIWREHLNLNRADLPDPPEA